MSSSGSQMENVDPWPTSEATSSLPWWLRVIQYAIDSPNPAPPMAVRRRDRSIR
jgi:hypothetical protein